MQYLQVLWRAVCQGAGPGAGRGGQHEQPAVQLRRQDAAGEGAGRRDRAPHDQQEHLQVQGSNHEISLVVFHYRPLLACTGPVGAVWADNAW